MFNRKSSDPSAFRVNGHDPSETAEELTRQSAAGYTCVEMTRRIGGMRMTFAQAAPDEPICLYEAIPWEKFWQPAGWDFFKSEKHHYYISRPLPPGTIVEDAAYGEEEFAEEQAWLAEHAARGFQLVAVRDNSYYFVPADPAELTYTVVDGGFPFSGARPLTPPPTEPDEHGCYFIDMENTGRAYFADAPSPLPPRTGTFMDADTCRAHFNSQYNRYEKGCKIFIVGVAIALWVIALGLAAFRPADLAVAAFLAVMGLINFGARFLVVRFLRRDLQKILDRLSPDGELPKAPPKAFGFPKKPSASPIPASDEAARLAGFRSSRRAYGLLALLCLGGACTSLCDLIGNQSADWFDKIKMIIAFLVFAAVFLLFIIRYTSISRKMREMSQSKKNE